jgi:hypothetical protein
MVSGNIESAKFSATSTGIAKSAKSLVPGAIDGGHFTISILIMPGMACRAGVFSLARGRLYGAKSDISKLKISVGAVPARRLKYSWF